MRLRYFHTSNHPLIQDYYQDALQDLGASWFCRNKKAKERVLKNLLVNLVMCQDHGDGFKEVSISRDRNFYKIDPRYRALHFKYSIYVPLMDALEQTGWLTQRIGFQDRRTGKSFQTRLMPTSRLKRAHYTPHPVSFFNDCPEPIELRNYLKQPAGYKETQATSRMRNRLGKYNSDLREHQISFTDSRPSYGAGEEQENPLRPHNSDDSALSLLNHSTMLVANPASRRIFNQSFRLGGRLYNHVQNISQMERATITIDGQPTQELDYKSLHPRMLYHREALQAPGDCYAVFSGDSLNQDLRPVIKLLMLIMINADTEKQAMSAFQRKWHQLHSKDPGKYPKLPELLDSYSLTLSEVVSQVKRFHNPIAMYFNTGIGIELQNWDSQIMDKVLVACTKEKVPVIPIHDSAIVPASEQEFLAVQLHQAYFNQMGQPIKIEAKGKYLN